MAALTSCPFCGRSVAIYATCQEMKVCGKWKPCEEGEYVCVVCSFERGGCGASTGFFPTKAEAAEAWNTRDEPYIVLEGPEIGKLEEMEILRRISNTRHSGGK